MEPWLFRPEFTVERLQLLVREMTRARATLALQYQPEHGDDPWCFGCQAYSRTCFALEELALSGEHPWLDVRRLGLRCKVSIGGHAISFFRGEADRPTTRSLRRGLEDLLGSRPFEFFEEELAAEGGDDWCWLLAIETNEDGTVSRVMILQANAQGHTRHLWQVPQDSVPARIAPVVPLTRQAVDLPAPPVGPKRVYQDRAASDEGDKADDPSE